MQLNSIEWITEPGYIGRVRELGQFTFQLSAQLTEDSIDFGSPVAFELDSGIFPMNLTLSESGLISGQVIDMDQYVPEFMEEKGDIKFDGSNYASKGSAKTHVHDCVFVVNAIYQDLVVPRTFFITVINNYSSDRDQMIRDYSRLYGEEGKIFQLDGQPVEAEAYLSEMKSRGFFI